MESKKEQETSSGQILFNCLAVASIVVLFALNSDHKKPNNDDQIKSLKSQVDTLNQKLFQNNLSIDVLNSEVFIIKNDIGALSKLTLSRPCDPTNFTEGTLGHQLHMRTMQSGWCQAKSK